jgi:hypothetical protein
MTRALFPARVALAAALLAITVASGPAEAQRERGLALYRRGTALLKAKSYQAAIRAFQASYRHHKHKNTLYAIGEAYRRLGKLRESHRYYSMYAEELGPEKRAAFAEKLDALRLGTPSPLTVSTRPPGATVSIDGEVRGATPPVGGLKLGLEAGRHAIRIQREGYHEETGNLQAEFGEPVTLDLALKPEPRAESRAPATVHAAPAQPRPSSSAWSPFVEAMLGPAFASYGDETLEVKPLVEVGLAGGVLWRSGRLGISLAATALYAPVHDEVVDDQAAFVTLLGGVGARWFVLPRLWLEASIALGTQLLAGADPSSFLVRQPGQPAETYAGFALRPALALGWAPWRGLQLQLCPLAVTYSPRAAGFSDLAPGIARVLRFQLGVGVGWQLGP